MGWKMKVPHFASLLRDYGYETHLFGFQHESEKPEELGYGFTHSQNDVHAEAVCSSVIDFIREKGADEGPWLAHAGFKEVHRPWPEKSTFNPQSIKLPPYLPDLPDIRNDYAYFYQNILEMDAQVGRVLDEIEKNGLAENTIVIFTSDHGSPFPGAKATFYDPGIRVPLIVQHKNKLSQGKVVEQLISNIDFMPTIFEYCGCKVPEEIEGCSFLPLLTGQGDSQKRDGVFGAMYYDVSYDPMYYVRTDRYKYIRSYGVEPSETTNADPRTLAGFKGGRWVRFDDYDVLTSLTWKSIEKKYEKPPKEELYDLKSDPHEQHNLALNPASANVLRTMRETLASMMKKTAAPLPNAHIAPNQVQLEKGDYYRKELGMN
jgi:arylsulfatase A-like enzyme